MALPPPKKNDSLKGEKPSGAGLQVVPSISQADGHLKTLGLPHGKPVRHRVAAFLNESREKLAHTPDGSITRQIILDGLAAALAAPPPDHLRRVINGTGVVIHTNLGRAVLTPRLTRSAWELAHGYANLEYNLSTGKRGGRGGQAPHLLARLSGGESALAVNNNAAVVLLLLAALGKGGQVIVSRGELVEIGGAFRVPDILRQSGCRLVEVGTTNRTRLADYQAAVTPKTTGLLKVHRSNFSMTGFVAEVSVGELAGLARSVNRERQAAGGKPLGVWHDLGSGNFYRFRQKALAGVPTVQQAVAEGADVVTFSGDKLLGSVQAGIAVGRSAAIQTMARHPLFRSLRMDKIRLALLEESLKDYLDISTLPQHNPTIGMLERTLEDMTPMAEALTAKLQASTPGPLEWQVVRGESLTGGGAVPEARIETLCLALTWKGHTPQSLADHLRRNSPPIIARLAEDRVLLDLRTLFPQDLDDVAQALLHLS